MSRSTPGSFYAQTDTAIPELDPRLEVFLEEYRRHRASLDPPLRVLDVACGRKAVLSRHIHHADGYWGCDIAPLDDGVSVPWFGQVDLNTEGLADRLPDAQFDVIFCGEVIEHVFSPDDLLEDLASLMGPETLLLLSTPNLGYWVNRLLLLAGVSPLFLENSARMKLGRKTAALGQGNPTEGHVRLFTYGAMRDMVELHGLHLLRTRSTPVWPLPVDRFVCRLSKSLAPVNTYVLAKRGHDARRPHRTKAWESRISDRLHPSRLRGSSRD